MYIYIYMCVCVCVNQRLACDGQQRKHDSQWKKINSQSDDMVVNGIGQY
jgi:hypothetical protein